MFNSDAIYMWAGQWAPIMLDATIKGAVLLGLAFLAAPILRKRSAAVRQLIWLMVLGVLLVWSKPFSSRVKQATRQVTEWTPENIQKDTVGYLQWALDSVHGTETHLEARGLFHQGSCRF